MRARSLTPSRPPRPRPRRDESRAFRRHVSAGTFQFRPARLGRHVSAGTFQSRPARAAGGRGAAGEGPSGLVEPTAH
jgi:hypothetical protein